MTIKLLIEKGEDTCPMSFSDGGKEIQNSFVDYPLNVDKELAAGY